MKLNNNDETRTKLVEDIYRQLKNKSFENNFNEGWYLADLELAHFNLPKQSSIEIFKIYAEKAKKECGYYQAIKKFSAILISQNIEIPEELRSIISQILREDIKKPRGKRVTNFNQRNTLGLLAFSLKCDGIFLGKNEASESNMNACSIISEAAQKAGHSSITEYSVHEAYKKFIKAWDPNNVG